MLAGLTCYHFIPFIGCKDAHPFDDDIIDSLHFIGFNEVRYIRRFDDFIGCGIQTYLRFVGSDIPIDSLFLRIRYRLCRRRVCRIGEQRVTLGHQIRKELIGDMSLRICEIRTHAGTEYRYRD